MLLKDLKELVRNNVLDIKPYVPGKPIEEVERELGVKNVIKLASNENPLGPSPLALLAMKEKAHQIFLYPDGFCYYLRDELSEKLGVKPANLMIGNGSDELLKLLAETFLNPGDEAVIGTPSFSEYEFAARITDGVPVFIDLKDFIFDLEAIAGAITAKTKMVFVCNPNNPTGTYVNAQEVEAFLDKVPEDVIVVFDEAYFEYVTAEDYPNTLVYLAQGRKNIVVLRTFSKIYGLAGLRIGYGIADEEIVSLVARVKEPFNVNLLAQEAARAAINDTAHIQQSKASNMQGRDYLYREFERLGLFYLPTQANFIFVKTGRSSKELFPEMLKRGVIIRTGDIFGYDEYIRVTIGTKTQNERFIATLSELL